MSAVLWLPWKPLRLQPPIRDAYNWVLLSYYLPWFLHNVTPQSSPHVAPQVSACMMGSKSVKHTGSLTGWLGQH